MKAIDPMGELGKFWASAPGHFAINLILNDRISTSPRLDIAKTLRPKWPHVEASEAGGATNAPQINGVEASCALVTPLPFGRMGHMEHVKVLPMAGSALPTRS